MKRALCLFMIAVVALGCCACTKQEENKPVSKYDALVTDAVEVLKKYWQEEIYLADSNYQKGDGYLQIANTRVMKIKDEPDIELDVHMFDNVAYVVEFILFANYYYTAPFYFNAYNQNSHVIVYKDGTMEVRRDVFDDYRSRTYSSDFTGIIEEVTDLGAAYNAAYILR